MADHTPPTTSTAAYTADPGVTGLIEKGATVHDAVGLSLGNVTDVDLERQRLIVDGRPVGCDLFEVPLSTVDAVHENEVRLNVAMEANGAVPGEAPRFTVPPQPIEPRGTPAPEPAAPAMPRESAAHAAFGSPIGTTVGATSAFNTSSSFTPPPRQHLTAGPAPTWAQPTDDRGDGGMFGPTMFGLAGLAAAGLAAGGYAWWRRRQRKSTLERAIDFATDFATDLHPAWWAALAAAALPVAYYLRPTETSSTAQARSWLDSVRESSRGLADDQLSALRRFKKHSADPQLKDLGRQAGRWAGEGSGQWERLVEAASALGSGELLASVTDHLPSMDSLPSRDDLPSFDDLLGDARDSRMATYGLSAVGIILAGAAVYALTRKARRASSSARVADVMTHRPQVIRPDASVAEAAALMRNLNVGAVPICDGSRLVGMLTDRDIAIRLAAEGRDPQLTRVRDIMSEGATWASEDDPVDEAARVMREHQIRRLPIVDESHNLVGIVSLGDLATDVGDDRLSGDTLEEISRR